MTEYETTKETDEHVEADTLTVEAPEEDVTASEVEEKTAEIVEEALPDYATIAKEDLQALKGEFPELEGLASLLELDNPERYGELRDLGLSPREAYLASSLPKREKTIPYDNRSHLRSSVPKSHGGRVDAMSISELREARELFAGMSDAEIVRLYKKVNS